MSSDCESSHNANARPDSSTTPSVQIAPPSDQLNPAALASSSTTGQEQAGPSGSTSSATTESLTPLQLLLARTALDYVKVGSKIVRTKQKCLEIQSIHDEYHPREHLLLRRSPFYYESSITKNNIPAWFLSQNGVSAKMVKAGPSTPYNWYQTHSLKLIKLLLVPDRSTSEQPDSLALCITMLEHDVPGVKECENHAKARAIISSKFVRDGKGKKGKKRGRSDIEEEEEEEEAEADDAVKLSKGKGAAKKQKLNPPSTVSTPNNATGSNKSTTLTPPVASQSDKTPPQKQPKLNSKKVESNPSITSILPPEEPQKIAMSVGVDIQVIKAVEKAAGDEIRSRIGNASSLFKNSPTIPASPASIGPATVLMPPKALELPESIQSKIIKGVGEVSSKSIDIIPPSIPSLPILKLESLSLPAAPVISPVPSTRSASTPESTGSSSIPRLPTRPTRSASTVPNQSVALKSGPSLKKALAPGPRSKPFAPTPSGPKSKHPFRSPLERNKSIRIGLSPSLPSGRSISTGTFDNLSLSPIVSQPPQPSRISLLRNLADQVDAENMTIRDALYDEAMDKTALIQIHNHYSIPHNRADSVDTLRANISLKMDDLESFASVIDLFTPIGVGGF